MLLRSRSTAAYLGYFLTPYVALVCLTGGQTAEARSWFEGLPWPMGTSRSGSVVQGEPDTSPAALNRLRTVKLLVEHWGYPYQEKIVDTEDGVRLTLHRVQYSRQELDRIKEECQSSSKPCQVRDEVEAKVRPPVLLAHGFLSSSSSFVFGPPHNSLGFLLADAGFDVWMHNTRGNEYSTDFSPGTSKDKPCTFDIWNVQTFLKKIGVDKFKPGPKPRCNETFWKFGLDEMAGTDLAAVIDKVLEWTNHTQLDYLGHSMGGTQYLILLSERPEYNAKIKTGLLLSPAAFLGHTSFVFGQVSFLATEIGEIYQMFFETSNFLPHNVVDLTNLALTIFLNKEPLCTGNMTELCHKLAPILGADPFRLDPSWIPMYLNHFPQGASLQTIVHFGQLASGWNRGNEFLKYDHGAYQNRRVYGQDRPPAYNLSNVAAPTILVAAQSDRVTSAFDVELLSKRLPNLVQYRVAGQGFQHLDYVVGQDAGQVINLDVVRWLIDPSASIPTYEPLDPASSSSGGLQGWWRLTLAVSLASTLIAFMYQSRLTL